MFGKRTNVGAPQATRAKTPEPAAAPQSKPAAPAPEPAAAPPPAPAEQRKSEQYYATKGMIFAALIEAIDLAQLSKLDPENAREEIRDIVHEIVAIKNVVMSISEQEDLLEDICNDVLGYGPLEPLLMRDDIADVMVNGASKTYIEVGGKIQLTNIRFRDNAQLMNICQRIVSQVGRRVDESSPICDARLLDGSRVNVIGPPLAIDGPALTIRKFRKDKLTLDQLIRYASISPEGGEVLKIIGRVRCNVLISGGTGSGKTTLLNALSASIPNNERIVTIEDAAELSLHQRHVLRLEARPPNIEGEGHIPIRDLVRNSLRMRPDRIIVGEVRGAEALDMLQAMNTGHDGSLTTVHSNSPRDCIARLETLVMFAGLDLPSKAIREQIAAAINVIVQQSRIGDGSRKVTAVSEV
ncbi:MAG TPA: CpaF family protein, partial [Methylosinus sp.]